MAQDLDFACEVGDKLLIVSDRDESELEEKMSKEGFTCISLNPLNIVDINGHIGKLQVTIKKEEELLSLDCDQIYWENAPKFASKQSGVYDDILTILKNKGEYRYKNYIKYDSSICQYHERNEEICGKCAEVCPTVAILKEDKEKHLIFSHIDCHGCGGCISVCPSGALDYAQMPRVAFWEVSKFFKDTIPLIIPKKMNLEGLHVELKEGVLPLTIEGEKFLHEAHLLSLAQTSGSQIIFYSDFISKGTGDVIELLNEIFKRKYGKKVVLIAKDENELKHLLYTAILSNKPFAIRYPRGSAVGVKIDEEYKKIDIGSWEIEKVYGDGNFHLLVLATGPFVHRIKEVCEKLSKKVALLTLFVLMNFVYFDNVICRFL